MKVDMPLKTKKPNQTKHKLICYRLSLECKSVWGSGLVRKKMSSDQIHARSLLQVRKLLCVENW